MIKFENLVIRWVEFSIHIYNNYIFQAFLAIALFAYVAAEAEPEADADAAAHYYGGYYGYPGYGYARYYGHRYGYYGYPYGRYAYFG